MTRRDALKQLSLFTGGGLVGAVVPLLLPPRGVRSSDADAGLLEVAPPRHALSLRAYSGALRRAHTGQGAIPTELTRLPEINVIDGVVVADSGDDVILFGRRHGQTPDLELSDLLVSLRSAYRVSDEYAEPPGCTIDPDPDAADPWREQIARVLGMPATAPMGLRHLRIDYEMKRLAAGLTRVAGEHGVPSIFDGESATGVCDHGAAPTQSGATHRFWFYPRYSDRKPRYIREGNTVLIEQPVGVLLLTEQELLVHGRRTGGADAQPEAVAFAKAMTRLLSTDDVPEYVRLRADFRIIEAGRVLRFLQAPAKAFEFLLTDCPVGEVAPHARFRGIRRNESGEALCGVTVRDEPTPRGIRSITTEHVQRYSREFRGGVEIAVTIDAADVVQAAGSAVRDYRTKVLSTRPSPEAVSWLIG